MVRKRAILWYGRGRLREDAGMEKDRLVAFSDGVIAIIITIMVLELKAPPDPSLSGLAAVTPVFLGYVLSFVYVAIYWNNHHHLFHLVRHVNGMILWANMHLLFWLSLIPFATRWMGENHFAPVPTAVYGVSLLMPALAWNGLQLAIVRLQGKRLRAGAGHRPRPEGQGFAGALCDGDPVLVPQHMDRGRHLRLGRLDVAHS